MSKSIVKQLLLATHNPAKLHELRIGVKKMEENGIRIITLNDLHISEVPEETGKTFEENAILKAKYYSNLTCLPVIADDGGLIIPALNDEPGVKSRRWLDYDATDEELIQYTLKRLRACLKTESNNKKSVFITGTYEAVIKVFKQLLNGVLKNKRTAYLKVTVCFYNPKTKFISCETEKIKGHIAEKPSGKTTEGYPFRALFIVNEFNKYFDELTEEEHDKINHRLKAVKRLIEKVNKYLL